MSETSNMPKEESIYWFYKWPVWLRILLCIFLFPIFIPILVWPKLKVPIWGKIAILVVWVIVMLVFSSSPSTEENNKDVVLNISGISENEIKKDDKLSLKIKTDPLTVDEVTVNGESASRKGWGTEYSFEKTYPEGDNKITVVAKKGDKKTEKVFNFKVDLTSKKLINSLINKPVPYEKWKDYGGSPETLEGTTNKYWVAYLAGSDISFISLKSNDTIIDAGYGKKYATEKIKNIEEERKKELQKGFSTWDGSHNKLTELIKESMNDPDSYEHVETVYFDQGDHLIVNQTFRGKNSFGGTVKNTIKAKVSIEGDVIEVIEQF